MDASFLKTDAQASIESIKRVLKGIDISPFYIAEFLRSIGKFLSNRLESLCDEQVQFISYLESQREKDVPTTTFHEEVARANWFIQKDCYTQLSASVACIADYVISCAPDYCERLSKEVVKDTKEAILTPLLKENKGLALVYLVNR